MEGLIGIAYVLVLNSQPLSHLCSIFLIIKAYIQENLQIKKYINFFLHGDPTIWSFFPWRLGLRSKVSWIFTWKFHVVTRCFFHVMTGFEYFHVLQTYDFPRTDKLWTVYIFPRTAGNPAHFSSFPLLLWAASQEVQVSLSLASTTLKRHHAIARFLFTRSSERWRN